jgi:hypothetical protein
MVLVNSPLIALFLIFGLGHPGREPVDPAKGAAVSSRVPCDGYTAPEEDLGTHATFSPGASAREFVVSRFHKEACLLDIKGKCLHKEKAEWREVWSVTSDQPSAGETLFLGSCDAWGSSDPAQYVLSGWYRESAAGAKPVWKQATLKQVSAQPEVFEFSDPNGGRARLELQRR